MLWVLWILQSKQGGVVAVLAAMDIMDLRMRTGWCQDWVKQHWRAPADQHTVTTRPGLSHIGPRLFIISKGSAIPGQNMQQIKRWG